MWEVENCKTCNSEMIPDPSPDRVAKRLLCIECDFKPESIKKEFEVLSKMDFGLKDFPKLKMPQIKSKPLLTEPLSEMNDYLRNVLTLVGGDETAIRDHLFGNSMNFSMILLMARHRYIYKYAWAIPCQKALKAIAKYSPIIEVGAGNGYWAYLLNKLGADILAFDSSPQNHYAKAGLKFHRQWFDVREGKESVVKDHQDRTLFLCWPPYNEEMAFKCLKEYKGKTVLYVGEGGGGCNASDNFFSHIEKHFTEEDCVELPVWYGIHDRLFIFERK